MNKVQYPGNNSDKSQSLQLHCFNVNYSNLHLHLLILLSNDVLTVALIFSFLLPDKMTHHCTKFSGHWKVSPHSAGHCPDPDPNTVLTGLQSVTWAPCLAVTLITFCSATPVWPWLELPGTCTGSSILIL